MSRLVTYQVGDLRQVLYAYALSFFTCRAGIIVVPASQLRGGVAEGGTSPLCCARHRVSALHGLSAPIITLCSSYPLN